MTGSYNYKFADVVWNICGCKEYSEKMLAPFKTDEPCDVTIKVDESDSAVLQNEKLLREINRRLCLDFEGLLFHSAAIVYNGKAYLFTAPSGVGKSTHASLWQKYVSESYILNGDKPFLRLTDKGATVYSGPWLGKEQKGRQGSAPLGGIFILKRSDKCKVKKPEGISELKGLLQAVLFEEQTDVSLKTLDILNKLAERVGIAELYCDISMSAVTTVKQYIDTNN